MQKLKTINNHNLSFIWIFFKSANDTLKKFLKSKENNSIMVDRLMLKKYVGQKRKIIPTLKQCPFLCQMSDLTFWYKGFDKQCFRLSEKCVNVFLLITKKTVLNLKLSCMNVIFSISDDFFFNFNYLNIKEWLKFCFTKWKKIYFYVNLVR